MWKRWLCVTLLLVGCKKTPEEQAAPTENEPVAENGPVVVKVVWSSMSSDLKETLHATLHSNREVRTALRMRDGTAAVVKPTLSKERYAKVIEGFRKLDCCSLKSASQAQTSKDDMQSQLELHLDGMECLVTLWDSEWNVGLARECGLAAAEFHGRGFPLQGATPAPEGATPAAQQ